MDAPGTPAPLRYTHGEFVAAYRAGTISVNFDPGAAARFLSARLLLPLFMLPVLGIGVALALTGWIWTGLAVIALGIIVPRLIKRGAPHFLLQQALGDEDLYRDVLRAGVMQVVPRAGG
ncbi:MAG: hypothetical protein ACO3F9_07690 [Burkholderiales bacterium]